MVTEGLMTDRNGGNANHRFDVKLTKTELAWLEELVKGKVDEMAEDVLRHVVEARERWEPKR